VEFVADLAGQAGNFARAAPGTGPGSQGFGFRFLAHNADFLIFDLHHGTATWTNAVQAKNILGLFTSQMQIV
jgi:hypothetical protein